MKIEAILGRSEEKGAYVSILIREEPEESSNFRLYLSDSKQELEEKMKLFSLLETKSIIEQCKEIIASEDPDDIPIAYQTLLLKIAANQKYNI